MGMPSATRKGATESEPSVARLPLHVTDVEIIGALHARTAAGGAALYDRYQRDVRRVLNRTVFTF